MGRNSKLLMAFGLVIVVVGLALVFAPEFRGKNDVAPGESAIPPARTGTANLESPPPTKEVNSSAPVESARQVVVSPELNYADLPIEDLVTLQEELYRPFVQVLDEEIAGLWEREKFETLEFQSALELIFPVAPWHHPRGKPFSDFRQIEGSEGDVEVVVLPIDEYPKLYEQFEEWRAVMDLMKAHPEFRDYMRRLESGADDGATQED